MKKISKDSVFRMITALTFALDEVKYDRRLGLCAGLRDASRYGICTDGEEKYLCQWISKMVGIDSFLERGIFVSDQSLRYRNRKPWVEWMIQHLKETT